MNYCSHFIVSFVLVSIHPTACYIFVNHIKYFIEPKLWKNEMETLRILTLRIKLYQEVLNLGRLRFNSVKCATTQLGHFASRAVVHSIAAKTIKKHTGKSIKMSASPSG